MDKITKVGKYSLMNPEKVNRALEGTPNDRGELNGGVADAEGKYDDVALLAEYDRIGGLIKKGEDKVITGSFYDFKARKPKAKAEVKFIYRVNGKFVEVKEDEEAPGEVKALKQMAQEAKAEKKAKAK
jgi:hypothetical protein